MIKKTTILAFAFLLALARPGKADEGMWLPFLINDMLYERMEEMGLELTREQIFSFNESSIKDAIVSFGGGCTAEIISDKGLLLTNHHCGYGRIQYHSTPENDILTDGFWAMNLEEELPNPGLFVRFLVAVEDVTEEFNQKLHDEMTLEERKKIIREVSDSLVEKATEENHYTANVRSMFAGNEFYLFTYERFDDVRLVGTPPSSIGKYGGDTDNWMWPRHTGDFSLFRVYTAPDGSPAEYHEDNIPLKPKHHLPVSIKGVEENDFAMVLGFPGSTDRYLTSYGIDYKLNTELPIRIDIRRQKLDIIEAAMAESDEIRIMYASRQSGIANYWKNFIGMSNALKRNKVADSKRETEEAFIDWVAEDPERVAQYGEVMNMFTSAYDGYDGFEAFNYIYWEAIASGPDAVRIAGAFRDLEELLEEKASDEKIEEETQKLKGYVDRFYRNYSMDVDKKMWAAMMETYYLNVPANLRPEIFNEVIRKFKGNFNRFADEVYKKSVFVSPDELKEFLDNPSLKTLQKDWAFRMASAINEQASEVRKQMAEYDATLEKARRLFLRGLREMDPEGMFYPDANSTMRFTFGSVKGYWPSDAVYFDYVTTLEGVMEKEDPGHHEFVVPEKLSELYQGADYGEYGSEDTQIVNFISDNDITGGNSGSPVLDGRGNLIGLAFDGNWEAMSGDILFENRMQRCINVDARYILFVIDKYAGAGHLIEEMTIIR